MLEEAIDIMHQLWHGGFQTHRGEHYLVEEARIYTLPPEPPPIMVAAGGPRAARLAGRCGDGLISTAPKADILQEFEAHGGNARPKYGQLTVCWDESEAEARRIAHRHWPNGALPGLLTAELKLPSQYETTASFLTEDMVVQSIVCGPDPERHLAAIQQFAAAGFDHVYLHQVGPKQDGFFQFYRQEVMPRLT